MYGWGAVSDRPMDFTEAQAARQLLLEEKIGRHARSAVADEDAEYEATLKAMSRRG